MDKSELRQAWAERVTDFQESGLTMKAWCEKNGFTMEQLKYWYYKHKSKSSRSDVWLPLTVTESAQDEIEPLTLPAPSMQIQVGPVRIEVYPGLEPQLLREVVSALVWPC
jgi:hypothetical protein